MTAFASVVELEALLGRSLDASQAAALLDAASSHLRAVVGQEITPRTRSTYTAYPNGGREDLPQWPVVSVDAVERNGEPIAYTYRPGFLMVDGDEPVDVTYTWGYQNVPGELARLTCVLAAQALTTIDAGLGLTSGGVSSVAIDDFKTSFADGGSASGMSLTPHATASVRAQFGRGDIHVVETGW